MIFILLILLLLPTSVSAQTNHIVISEIQVYGKSSKDEFIKLYNPTSNSIDISGWKLTKKTSTGTEANLVSKFDDNTFIPANSEFLITHKTDYIGNETANYTYSGASYSVAINNTILLKNSYDAIIDKVGFGEALDFESQPTLNPENGTSIKRINNEDTDNNKNDFNNISTNNTADTQTQNINTSLVSKYKFGDVLINRLLPNPLEGKEWIEIFNTKNTPIDLTGWYISDGATKIYDLSGKIDDYIIIEVNNRLNNSGDSVILTNSTNQTIDIITYGNWYDGNLDDNWPTPEKGEILTRENENINIEEYKNIKTNSTTSTTINKINLVEENITDISSIQISEILPNPTGDDTLGEWIEVYNSSTSTDINIGGFYLDDNDGGSKPYKITEDTIIKANTFVLFDRIKTKLALNNNYDAVRILDKNQKELLIIEYEDAKEGFSYAYKNNWQWTSTPTPLKENNITSTSSLKISTSQTTNYITGIVIVPPNIFSTQIMYIDGKQLYMYTADWPELKIGDKISVWGEPSTYYNEPRLKLKNKNSIKIISQNNNLKPENITPFDISDELVGKYINIEGEVIEVQSKKIFIDVDGVEISIIKKGDIKFPKIYEQDLIQASGVLSKYKDDFRILPTQSNDIQILTSGNFINDVQKVEKEIPFWYYIGSTLAFTAIISGITIKRRRRDDGTQTTKKETFS